MAKVISFDYTNYAVVFEKRFLQLPTAFGLWSLKWIPATLTEGIRNST